MTQISWLDAEQTANFPPTALALTDPNGLLAAGGQLTPDWLLAAYKKGIFPWFSDGEPIMWWSPAPRMVLTPGHAHISRSLRKAFRKHPVELYVNKDFRSVMNLCADSPTRDDGTWITDDMLDAYQAMHEIGFAHSIEVYRDNQLIGGLYGIAIESVFFGESMFSIESGASKYAFIGLSELAPNIGIQMIDCQLHNPYLASLGANLVDRNIFEKALPKLVKPVNLGSNNDLTHLLVNKLGSESK